jgi:hypothetical protein
VLQSYSAHQTNPLSLLSTPTSNYATYLGLGLHAIHVFTTVLEKIYEYKAKKEKGNNPTPLIRILVKQSRNDPLRIGKLITPHQIR